MDSPHDRNAPSSSDPVYVPKKTDQPGRYGVIGGPVPIDRKARYRGETPGMTLTIGENRGHMIPLYVEGGLHAL